MRRDWQTRPVAGSLQRPRLLSNVRVASPLTLTDKGRWNQLKPHEMTPRQFWESKIKKCMKERGVSRNVAEFVHRRRNTDPEHLQHALRACENGVELRRQVLDAMHPLDRHRILHDFPRLHRWYQPPHERRLAREGKPLTAPAIQDAFEHERKMVERIYEEEDSRFRFLRLTRRSGQVALVPVSAT